jgi:hypothetical protein
MGNFGVQSAVRIKPTVGEVRRAKRLILINVCFLVLPSVVLEYYLGAELNTLFAVLGGLSLLIALHESRWAMERQILILSLMLCGLGFIGSLFSGTPSQALMGITLSLNMVIVSCGWQLFAEQRTLRYLLVISSILIVGAIIAVSYAASGGTPLTTIHFPDRESHLYLSTFTDAVTGSFIRPSGIFDEPGALAMFLTVVVALNEAIRANIKWSATILFLGLITGSLALFLVIVAYALYKMQLKNITKVILVLAVVSSVLFLNDRISKIAGDYYFSRLEVVDGRLAGDDRSGQIEAFFELVNMDITLKGNKALDNYNPHYDQSSNPFSIYFSYGIFMWIPYMVLEIWLLYCSFFYLKHLRFPAMSMFLTLLQRPYIYSLHWGMMIILVVITIYRLQKSESRKIKTDAFLKPIIV